MGFAVREVSLGETRNGRFHDKVIHKPSQEKTTMYASSTDPWHRASDIDRNFEHASLDRVFASGLTSGKPLLAAVPVLYGVPEDAAALLRYVRSRSFPVKQIEMGEEPDGQLAQPEHYAALYGQVADALKEVDPEIQLGGPGYQTVIPDWIHWPDENGVKSWTGRFVSHLRERNRMEDFSFFSFEWYPSDDICADTAKPLQDNPKLLEKIMQRQEAAGLPPEIPKVITELGYSAFAGRPEVEMPGAILNAETTAKFLEQGGTPPTSTGLSPTGCSRRRRRRANRATATATLCFPVLRRLEDASRGGLLRGAAGEQCVGSARRRAPRSSSDRRHHGTRPGGPSGHCLRVKAPGCAPFSVDLQQGSKEVHVRAVRDRRRRRSRGRQRTDRCRSILRQAIQVGSKEWFGLAWAASKNDPPLRETREAEEGAVIDLPPYSITVVTMEE